TVLLLAVGLVGGGAGLAARQAPASPAGDEKEGTPKSAAKAALPSPNVDKPARTDRYGDPLPQGAIARLGTVRFRHGSTVTGLAFGPDGKTLISGSYDKTLRIWEVATGRELQRFPSLMGSVFQLCASRDKKTLAAVDNSMLYLADVA